jgi:transglutaminase-like putative cysteine protease
MAGQYKGGPLPLPNLLWMLAGLILVVAPHAERLPWWVNGTAVAMAVWRIYICAKQGELPRRWFLLALALGQTIGVYFTYRSIFGRDAGVTLLVLLLALKLMETQAQRDVFVMIFLAYFVALTNFLYSQTILIAVCMLAAVLVITAALVGFNALRRPMLENLRTGAWMLVQAAPIMLLLFFLFPRVQGPLWGMPQDAFGAASGLSDTMSPGSISRLSQSDAIAFRVKFQGPQPAQSKLYWRGPVFSRFDGRTWSAGAQRFRNSLALRVVGLPVDYEITLEPHNRTWLFALEMPRGLPPSSRITSDYQLVSLAPVRSRMRYEVRSYPLFVATDGGERADLREALVFPPGFNPRAQSLAREWRSASSGDAEVVRRAIMYFSSAGLQYTLLPSLLGRDSIDEFLFDTKEGFCEHFASSFVFLMRVAGVPARVVTGYQGGDVNPVDGYMIVREADAHAWAEVWLGEERGWLRVDPTAAAAPMRIERGLAEAVPQSDALPLMVRQNLGWVRSLRNGWEALANQWNQWVLGYNPDRQREMLSRLGMEQPSWQNMIVLLFWSVAAAILAIALWVLSKMRHREGPVQRAWTRFCAKLARVGLQRGAAEGPLDYATRASGRLPARAEGIRSIAGLYVELRYGRETRREVLFRFRNLVRDFKA